MESGGIDWDVRARRGHRLALLTGWAPAHASSSSAEERRMAWPGQWRTRKGAFSRVLSLCARSVSTFNLARTPSKIRRTDHSRARNLASRRARPGLAAGRGGDALVAAGCT
uniref:Uncharacterized protein n=1 Tax=Oryza barthii TaxID=65489 RepID=A0A0D3EV17_9ORYZ